MLCLLDTRTHTHTHTHTHTYAHVRTHTCARAHTHTHTHRPRVVEKSFEPVGKHVDDEFEHKEKREDPLQYVEGVPRVAVGLWQALLSCARESERERGVGGGGGGGKGGRERERGERVKKSEAS